MSDEKPEEKKPAAPRRKPKALPQALPTDAATMAPLHKRQKFVAQQVNRWDIQLATYNPRGMNASNKAALQDEIRKGLVSAPTWNQRTKNLVGGHQRIAALDAEAGPHEACRGKGCPTCHGLGVNPYSLTVDMIDVDDAEEKRTNIALNNPKLQGYYDIDTLQPLLLDLRESNVSLEDMGFEVADLANMGMADPILLEMAPETPAALKAMDAAEEAAQIAKMKQKKREQRTSDRATENQEINGQVIIVCRTGEAFTRIMKFLGRSPDDDPFIPDVVLRRLLVPRIVLDGESEE